MTAINQSNKPKWNVGDTVFLEGLNRNASTTSTITKIGCKWITLEGWRANRFNPETGMVDGKGYTSPYKVWKSKEECDEWHNLRITWEKLKYRIDRIDTPTLEQMAFVSETLGLNKMDIKVPDYIGRR